MSRALAGPYAAMTLGDLGADVIKIEDPRGGDATRDYPPFWNGQSTYFLSANRNKRSLTLNLASPEAREIVRQPRLACRNESERRSQPRAVLRRQGPAQKVNGSEAHQLRCRGALEQRARLQQQNAIDRLQAAVHFSTERRRDLAVHDGMPSRRAAPVDEQAEDPLRDLHVLGQQRAEIVRVALIKLGIVPDDIRALSRGKRSLAVQTPNGVAEPLNRRVEIIVR